MSRAQVAVVVLAIAAGGMLWWQGYRDAQSDVERAVDVAALLATVALVAARARRPGTGGGITVTPAGGPNIVQLAPRRARLVA